MADENFIANTKTIKQKIRGRERPYFQELEHDPIILNLNCAYDGTWTDSDLQNIKQWLKQSYYKPLIFSENPNIIYYVMLIDEPRLIHNYNNQGYFTCTFENIDCYRYSPVYSLVQDISSGSETCAFMNLGDVTIFPKLEIEKLTEDGEVSIVNNSDNGREFSFSTLTTGETVTVYNYEQDIESSIAGTYRYDKHNGNWLRLLPGNNNLVITGKCNITFTYDFKYW